MMTEPEIFNMAVEYIKQIDFRDVPQDTKKKCLHKHFTIFCHECGVKNTIESYREYRSACRGVLGFDIIKQRPKKHINPVEMQTEMFF